MSTKAAAATARDQHQALALRYFFNAHELLDKLWLLLNATGLANCLTMLGIPAVSSLQEAHLHLKLDLPRLQRVIKHNWAPWLQSPIDVRRRLFADYQKHPLPVRELLAGFLLDDAYHLTTLFTTATTDPDTLVAEKLRIKDGTLPCLVRNDMLALFADYMVACRLK
jgi:hypothetical protein